MEKILAIFILLALPGCFGQQEQPQQPVNTEVNADSILDNQIYASAVQANDAKQCATIKDAAKKDECGKVVEANLLTAKAVEKMDADFCDGIELERYKESCEGQLKQQTELEAKREDLTESNKIDSKYYKEAIEATDIIACEKITDSNLKTACKTDVTIKKATENKDIKICESLSEKSQIDVCKEFTQIY